MKRFLKLAGGALLLLVCLLVSVEEGLNCSLICGILVGLGLMGVGGLTVGNDPSADADDPEDWNSMVDQVNEMSDPKRLDRLARIFRRLDRLAKDPGAPPLGELCDACEEKAAALRQGLPARDLSHLRIVRADDHLTSKETPQE